MKKQNIAIVGLGYVGLPLAIECSRRGHRVIGIDQGQGKVHDLHRHRSYINEVDDKAIEALMNESFTVTDQCEEAKQATVIILCVPTPLASTGTPNLCYVQTALKQLAPHLQQGQLLILESSTFPGTTEEIVVPLIEREGFHIGKTFFVGYSPERIDPGNKQFHLTDVPKVISGMTSECLQRVKDVYETIFKELVPVSSTRVAEAVKMFENTQRFINLSFVNEMARACYELEINVEEVLLAAETKPYGSSAYRPGPGVGGHCIPVDPLYFKWKVNQVGATTRFIDLAKAVNDEQPDYIVKRIRSLIHSVEEAAILLIGLSYKKNTKDTRESKSIGVAERLIQAGFTIAYHDPFVPVYTLCDQAYQSITIAEDTLAVFDLVVLLTDHDDLDYDKVVQHSKCIFDTKQCLSVEGPHIHKL
ncbi:nucleotide sugar dehydrogenase [Shouchella miscanthi]|uniref:Nucleotide sugar dehydrogenase n=1 Tax=Shouchella miscanthi TaxID=2598861 RepID=A0ABU6NHQ5_9BACI|nr:nucleotide sugar dehydrogenase [Shouchella miscanthi]MED4127561.1 nucleotide sugar dehydrogenase [Shouchella miscanthi]